MHLPTMMRRVAVDPATGYASHHVAQPSAALTRAVRVQHPGPREAILGHATHSLPMGATRVLLYAI